MRLGIHTVLQHTDVDELRAIWTRAEELGFESISIADHFYASDGRPECFEAVAAQTALACWTDRVRVGSLVYCAAYRHPGVIAKAVATIDRLSGGRAELGIGAGWDEHEYEAFGIPFEAPRARLDLAEESLQCVRRLLHDGVADFEGRHFRLRNAQCAPRPLQPAVPIWVGGVGERRTLPMAARWADGWNAPYLSPEAFAAKRTRLLELCEEAGRAGAVRCAVNVALASDESALVAQFGSALAEGVKSGSLLGSAEQMVDQIGAYRGAGADQLNLVMRAPWEHDRLEAVAASIASI